MRTAESDDRERLVSYMYDAPATKKSGEMSRARLQVRDNTHVPRPSEVIPCLALSRSWPERLHVGALQQHSLWARCFCCSCGFGFRVST